jgi:glycosyltransferase involved in cell wall biosynthesis
LRTSGEPPVDGAICERCAIVETVERPLLARTPWRMWPERRRVLHVLRGSPPWVIGCSVAAYRTRLRSLVRRWQPDVVQIEYAAMGQYARDLRDLPAARILVDLDVPPKDDPMSHATGRAAFRRDSWGRYRTAIMQDVDAVVALTERDRTELERLAAADVSIVSIPLAIDPPATTLNPLGAEPPSLLFVGSYAHPPNVEAARRLVEEIFPRLRSLHPSLVLRLVGPSPPEDLAGDGVDLTGRVPDVTPYLDAATVVVAPLSSGGGMRVKVLEALGAGKAVVATALAVEGLDLVGGEHVALAETDDEFVQAIDALLRDPNGRAAVAAHARAWAAASGLTKRSVEAYEALYDSTLMQSVIARPVT